MKYTAAKWSSGYRSGAGIRISDSAGFTWGTGSYVTPIAYPYSSAIFGRVGVVAQFDPHGWKVFDATATAAQDLYLAWLRYQPMARQATLTTHSALYNHFLRDRFREHYGIDCVLFAPDQTNPVYTRGGDVWMAVSDWRKQPGRRRLATGESAMFKNTKLTVLVEEEFEDRLHGLERAALLNLTSRPPAPAATTAAIAQAYAQDAIVRIRA